MPHSAARADVPATRVVPWLREIRTRTWGVRSLLGVVSAGFVVVTLFAAVMSYFDDATSQSFALTFSGVFVLGLFGLLSASVGRAFARWSLVGFGILLIGGAAYGLIESFSYTSGVGWFEFVMVGGMVLFGVCDVMVSWRSIREHRFDRLSLHAA